MERIQQERELLLAKLNPEREIQMKNLKVELKMLRQSESHKQREHELKKLEAKESMLTLRKRWRSKEPQ